MEERKSIFPTLMSTPSTLPTFAALRYVQPLREGGSLPAIVDTDGGLFVVKFRGAGQGAKALVAELIAGMLAQELDLPVPELALVYLPAAIGRNEPDSEIREILRKSTGMNVGLRYLDGSFNFDAAAAGDLVSPDLAARIVWLDALLTNPDRTARNTNLLIQERRPWLIDHGAALYAHHDWSTVDDERVRAPFPRIRDHVLLEIANDPRSVDAALAARLTPEVIDAVVARVPDALLEDEAFLADGDTPDSARARYRAYLRRRVEAPRAFADDATEQQAQRRIEIPLKRTARR